jgi:gas vesicle protein
MDKGKKENHKMTNRDAFMGFLAGAVAGAAVALLYAPQSGQKTRGLLIEKGTDATLRARELGVKAKDSLLEARNGAEQSVSDAAAGIVSGANRLAAAAASRTS